MVVKIGVVGRVGLGEADVVFFDVDLADEVLGTVPPGPLAGRLKMDLHRAEASRLAQEAGFKDCIAFGAGDPLWAALAPKRDTFFQSVASELQTCFGAGHEPSGSDVIGEVSRLVFAHMERTSASAWLVLGPGLTFHEQIDSDDGTATTRSTEEPRLVFDEALMRSLVNEGATAVEFTGQELGDLMEDLPSVVDLRELCKGLEDGSVNGKEIASSMRNVADAMGIDVALPDKIDPILTSAWTAWKEGGKVEPKENNLIVADGWGHCFVGSIETNTRWVFSREDRRLLIAQVDLGAGRWEDLGVSEAGDLLESIIDNDIPAMSGQELGDAFGLYEMDGADLSAHPQDITQSAPRERG